MLSDLLCFSPGKSSSAGLAMMLLMLLTALAGSAAALGSMKTVTVSGQVGCGDRSIPGVEVELWEHDTADPDDLLNKTVTDKSGRFSLYGQENEIGNIEPYLLIKHSCDNGVVDPKCAISDEYDIPKDRVGKAYDMGIISLNIARKNHKKKCKK